MWRSLEVDAIALGLTYEYFWSINPKIYNVYRDAMYEREKEAIRKADFLNHLLGQYIGIAVNDGKKYPSKPYLDPVQPTKVMTDEEMEQQARRNTIMMGGNLK